MTGQVFVRASSRAKAYTRRGSAMNGLRRAVMARTKMNPRVFAPGGVAKYHKRYDTLNKIISHYDSIVSNKKRAGRYGRLRKLF
jgi:hypothetical protein